MLRFLRVSGDSLYPSIREGDFVILSKIPFMFRSARRGDIVAFSHAQYGIMIKRVDWISADRQQLYVLGTHEWSVDSRLFGPIESNAILGKVIWHIPKSDR